MKGNILRYLCCSDIHLGHLKTPTQHIINSFKTTILTEENKTLDILFINGDLFDRLLDLNTKEVSPILDFFNYLLSYCQVNDILLDLNSLLLCTVTAIDTGARNPKNFRGLKVKTEEII